MEALYDELLYKNIICTSMNIYITRNLLRLLENDHVQFMLMINPIKTSVLQIEYRKYRILQKSLINYHIFPYTKISQDKK